MIQIKNLWIFYFSFYYRLSQTLRMVNAWILKKKTELETN